MDDDDDDDDDDDNDDDDDDEDENDDEEDAEGGGTDSGSQTSSHFSSILAEEEEDAAAAIDVAALAHVRVLGAEARARVLAGLYLCRFDTSQVVRQSALVAWKNVVTNTPRTLRETLPALLSALIGGLSSGDEEREEACGKCLGEMVRKMGDRVLPTMVPLLRAELTAPGASPAQRRGVCAGLSEVVSSANRPQLAAHLPSLLPTVQFALCDEGADVRAAAGAAFAALQRALGPGAVQTMIPALLEGVEAAPEGPLRARALAGLAVVVSARPKDVLSALLPRLVAAPISAARAAALGVAAAAGGAVLHYFWPSTLPALVAALVGGGRGGKKQQRVAVAGGGGGSGGETAEAQAAAVTARLRGPLGAAAAAAVRAVTEHGASWIVEETVKLFASPCAHTRRVTAWLLHCLISAAPWGGEGAPNGGVVAAAGALLCGPGAPVAGGGGAAAGAGAPPPPPFALPPIVAPGPPLGGQVPYLLRELVARACDADEGALRAAWDAVGGLLAGVVAGAGEEAVGTLGAVMDFLRGLLGAIVSDARFKRGGVGGSAEYHLPALSLPRGLDALLPLYLRALMAGAADVRRDAADGLGDLVDITSQEGLKPFFIKITGPLIRVAAGACAAAPGPPPPPLFASSTLPPSPTPPHPQTSSPFK